MTVTFDIHRPEPLQVDGKPIHLTPAALRVFQHLTVTPGTVVPLRVLARAAYNYAHESLTEPEYPARATTAPQGLVDAASQLRRAGLDIRHCPGRGYAWLPPPAEDGAVDWSDTFARITANPENAPA